MLFFVETVRGWLVKLTEGCPDKETRYCWHKSDGGIDVTRAVSFYTSSAADSDQDDRYNEFSRLCSEIRIMGGTTATSAGVNIGDMKLVGHWDCPITMDLEDIL